MTLSPTGIELWTTLPENAANGTSEVPGYVAEVTVPVVGRFADLVNKY